tara:strand:+ start:1377 stop:1595 length:219 start_codon:yes stop_codon:yes gene_type:complete
MKNYYISCQVIETVENLVKAKSEEEAVNLFYGEVEKNWGEAFTNASSCECYEVSTEKALKMKGYWDQPVEWL